jgi:outer membrane protein OmpA-like peptidoglycan-associated protein
MHKKSLAVLAGLLVVALGMSTGCVSKKVFRKNVEETDARLAGVETGLEQNERRTSDLAQETDSKIAEVRGTAQKAVEIGTEAMTTAEEAKKMARGKVLWTTTLSDDRVRFSFDQNELPDAARSILDDLAQKVKGLDRTVYVEIEGHTDSIGSEAYNKMLGEKRADAVRNYLAQTGGIPLHVMNVISYGEASPVAENNTPEGRSQNRRVVIRVLE